MDELGQRTMSKVTRRLVPFLIVCFIAAYIDRVNVGVAAIQMNAKLGFTSTMYAIGAGIFFLGYFLFEVPSNMMLHKFGARVWIARIMFTWGLVSGATAFVWNAPSFYAVRILLGVFEAGFFPGIVLYLTYWIPSEQRGRVFGLFLVAVPIAITIGAPISTALLSIDWLGLDGWQWMFILEAIPSLVLAIVVLFYLTDKPEQAKWLTQEERDWLVKRMAQENSPAKPHSISSMGRVFTDKRVYLCSIGYIGVIMGTYGITLWLPQIVKGFGLSNTMVGFVSALPFAAATIAQVYWTRKSDEVQRRGRHVAIALVVSSAGLLASAYTSNPVWSLIALGVAAMGAFSAQGTFWTVPTSFMVGSGAAVGIATINSIGNLGGFLGPYVVGYIRDFTGEFSYGLLFLAVTSAIGAIIIANQDRQRQPDAALGTSLHGSR